MALNHEINIDIKHEIALQKIAELTRMIERLSDSAEVAGKLIEDALSSAVPEAAFTSALKSIQDEIDKTASEAEKLQTATQGMDDGQELEALKQRCSDLESELVALKTQFDMVSSAQAAYNGTLKESTSSMNNCHDVLVKMLGGQENYKRIMDALPPSVSNAIKGIEGMTAASKAFIATPLGLTLAAIATVLASLVTWFKSSSEGEMAFAEITGYVTGVLDQLKEVVINVGGAIYNAFTNPKQAVKDLWNAIKENLVNRLQGIGKVFKVLGEMISSVFSGDFDSGKWATMSKSLANAAAEASTGVENLNQKLVNYGKHIANASQKSAEYNRREKQLERDRVKWLEDEQLARNELDALRTKMYQKGADKSKIEAQAQEVVNKMISKEKELLQEELAIQQGRMALTTNTDADYKKEAEIKRELEALEGKRLQTMLRFNRAAASQRKTSSNAKTVGVNVENAKNAYKQAASDLQKEVAEAEIAAMSKGNEKVEAQIEQNYRNRMAKIAKLEEELTKKKKASEGQSATLDSNETDMFKRLRELAAQEAQKQRKEELDQVKKDQQAYLEQYGSFQEQKQAIAEKYDKMIAEAANKWQAMSLEKQRDSALQQLSFDQFKKDPNFSLAFSDPNKVGVETLKKLIEEFENKVKEGATNGLNLEELKIWMDAASSMYDNLLNRDPFAALAESAKKLSDAQNELTTSQKKLDTARSNGGKIIETRINKDGKLVTVERTITDLEEEHKKKLKNLTDAQRKHLEAIAKTTTKIDELASAISSLGDAIGGEEGEILKCIANAMTFATTAIRTIEDVSISVADGITTTMQAIESASAILKIIALAIQLMQQISKLDKSAHEMYEAAAEKQAAINDLRDSVAKYQIAVEEAAKSEKEWFATTRGASLRNQWKVSENAADAYFKKLNEKQAKYVNEGGGGWLTKFFNATSDLGSYLINGLGLLDNAVGTVLTAGANQMSKGFNSLSKTVQDGMSDEQQYIENYTSALNNLRIETKAASKGFLGTGIGGKAQQTEDLSKWVKDKYKEELFDESGWINLELANQVIEDYGDKLVGETKKTIEALIEYKEKYDEFRQQLEEAVSSLYSPLADNLTDALWDWYKNGTDVMDSFKEYAADTFESIAKDAIKSAVLNKLFKGYQDKIADLYEQYSFDTNGEKYNETWLMNAVAAETTALTNQVNEALPVLQAMTQSVGDAIAAAGYASNSSQELSASSRSVASMSEDTASELNGRFTSIQLSMESVDENIKVSVQILTSIQSLVSDSNNMLNLINSNIIACNGTLNVIYDANSKGFANLASKMDNLNSTINNKM